MCCSCGSLPKIANIIKDISQENRLHILCILSKVKSLCVCEITEELGVRQNLVSHHLKVLKDIGLLITKREGKNIHYAIHQKKFSELKKNIAHIFNI